MDEQANYFALQADLVKASSHFEQKLRESLLIRRIGEALSQTRDVRKLGEDVVDAILGETEAESCSLMLLDEDNNELYLMASKRLGDDKLRYFQVPSSSPRKFSVGVGVAGWVAKACKQAVVPDVSKDARYIHNDLCDPDSGSMVCVPMAVHDKAAGVLSVSHKSPNAFSSEDAQLLDVIADHVAIALNNVRAFDELKQFNRTLEEEVARKTERLTLANEELQKEIEERQRIEALLRDREAELEALNLGLEERVRERTFEIDVLHQLTQQIGYALNYDDLFRSMLAHLDRAVPYDVAASLIKGEESHEVLIHAANRISVVAQQEVLSHLVEEFERISEVDVNRELIRLRFVNEEAGPREISGLKSFFLVPLMTEGEITGLLYVGAEGEGQFTPKQMSLISSVVNQASGSIYKVRLLLASEQRRLEQLVEHLPFGVGLLDAQNRLVLVNSAAKEFLWALGEVGPGEMVQNLAGKPISVLMDPGSDGLPHELSTSGKKKRIFEADGRALNSSDGNEARILLIREVTSEREIQEQQRQKDRLAAVGQLAAGISHDFNNLLTIIMGYADLWLRRPSLPEEARKDMETISSQGNRGAQLIEQILDFSRKSLSESQVFDLVPFLRETLRMLERTLSETVRIDFEFERGDHYINANPGQMQEILLNLAVNARDAMPNGGDLRIRLCHVVVEAGQKPPAPDLQPGTWVLLEVADTGEGMSDETRQHAFEPFFTTKAPGEGTGLGLAQSHGIVKQQGGEIFLESLVGEGTSVRIFLPKAESLEPSNILQTAEVIRGNGETILLVEDEQEVLEITTAMLEAIGYVVIPACNGMEALEFYAERDGNINLVLTDTVMPQLDGLGLLKALKKLSEDVRVVMMTGYPLGEEEAFRFGALSYIKKPLKLASLSQAVHNAMV
jgi:two-component system cell cycle sensor histidine kinase/response regulator CckA